MFFNLESGGRREELPSYVHRFIYKQALVQETKKIPSDSRALTVGNVKSARRGESEVNRQSTRLRESNFCRIRIISEKKIKYFWQE